MDMITATAGRSAQRAVAMPRHNVLPGEMRQAQRGESRSPTALAGITSASRGNTRKAMAIEAASSGGRGEIVHHEPSVAVCCDSKILQEKAGDSRDSTLQREKCEGIKEIAPHHAVKTEIS